MTINELEYVYGTKDYVTSFGDDIYKISSRIYGEVSDVAINVLRSLNFSLCWDMLEAGTVIKYLPEDALKYVSEITD